MFVRFTLNRQDERSGSREGIFSVAYREAQNRALADYERAWLEELLEWFKRKLKIPRPVREDRNRRAICWFREDAKEVVAKAWELAVFLKERGYHLDVERTDSPGIVVYDDGNQVAAKPLRKGRTYFKDALAEGAYDEKG